MDEKITSIQRWQRISAKLLPLVVILAVAIHSWRLHFLRSAMLAGGLMILGALHLARFLYLRSFGREAQYFTTTIGPTSDEPDRFFTDVWSLVYAGLTMLIVIFAPFFLR